MNSRKDRQDEEYGKEREMTTGTAGAPTPIRPRPTVPVRPGPVESAAEPVGFTFASERTQRELVGEVERLIHTVQQRRNPGWFRRMTAVWVGGTLAILTAMALCALAFMTFLASVVDDIRDDPSVSTSEVLPSDIPSWDDGEIGATP